MTIYYTVVGTAVGLFMTTMTAYVVSRKEFKYRNIVTFMMYFTTIFGGGMIPWYLLYANVMEFKGNGICYLVSRHHELISCDPMRTFIQSSVPDAIAESAKIDGAGPFTIFIKNRPAGIKARSCNSGIVPGAWLLE